MKYFPFTIFPSQIQSYEDDKSVSDNTWASDLKSFIDDSQIQKKFPLKSDQV